jgi:hypothetical protein
MPSWLGTLWEFLISVLRFAFGDRVDTGWGIIASLWVTVVAVAFVIGGYHTASSFLRALDVKFNKEKLDEANLNRPTGTSARLIDWKLARIQQVRTLRFTIPFGLLVLGVLYWWVREFFTFRSYAVFVVCWVIFMILVLRVWWIATVVWTERKLVKKGEKPARESRLHNVSVIWALKHYLNWGTQKPTIKRAPYIGLFRPLNPVIWLFRLRWLQIRLVRPLLVCAFYATFWPLTMVIGVFYLTREFRERNQLLKPEWASNYALEPTYASGAIPDTPGDAQAAKS